MMGLLSYFYMLILLNDLSGGMALWKWNEILNRIEMKVRQ